MKKSGAVLIVFVLLVALVGLQSVSAGNVFVKNGVLNATSSLLIGASTLFVNSVTGFVGIGTITPTSTLTVNGTTLLNGTTTINGNVSISGGEVQTGTSSASCTSSNAGAIRYNGGDFYGCNGFFWVPFASTNINCAPGGSNGISCNGFFRQGYIYDEFTYNYAPGTTTWTVPSGVTSIDIFLVGGGSGGAWAGGAGGFTKTYTANLTGASIYRDGGAIPVYPGEVWTIVVGPGGVTNLNGGATSFFNATANYSAPGGVMAAGDGSHGQGNGGSGGGGYGSGLCTCNGSDDGGNGTQCSTYVAGLGQNHTTREFGEASGQLYAGGAGGCNGGATCSGTGGFGAGAFRQNGTTNTGGGGGCYTGWGGSGIVIVRYT